MRIGQGIDVHGFAQEARPLVLGGIGVEYDRGLEGHSDGDVVLHALIDALLGAAALGDIGQMFPSDDGRWAGADSRDLLAHAMARVAAGGFSPANADVTIVAEAPRLQAYVPRMREAIAAALGIDITKVSVKATTTDGLGFAGRGEGIAAFAVVLLD
jgi:2-C-methyl-D-erythritol 2,4-cyclodiphosphate synthase